MNVGPTPLGCSHSNGRFALDKTRTRDRGPLLSAFDAHDPRALSAFWREVLGYSQSCSRAYRAASWRVRVWVFCIALDR